MKTLLAALAVLCWVFCCDACSAQTLDLYQRVSDPRGIAILNTPDSTESNGFCVFGLPHRLDLSDSSNIIAEDTGGGVITHMWSTAGDPDTMVFFKLWIDDTLRLSDYHDEFFDIARGPFRPPLNLGPLPAHVLDVQIPYHHSFRWTAKAPGGNIYSAITWHKVDPSILPYFSSKPTGLQDMAQVRAEKRILSTGSPWDDSDAVVLRSSVALSKDSAIRLADIAGEGMTQIVHIHPSTSDVAILDSTWLNMYWDDCPTPSVHAPLIDFFCATNAVGTMRSLFLRSDPDSGFTSYFPMPFYRHARIELVRTASTPLLVDAYVQYHLEPINRNKYGYFFADFNESNPTRYHVWHPMLHTVGRGRYVGVSWGIVGEPWPVFLEGDPVFVIDSGSHRMRYTGSEDYFDGGFWFPKGPFTLPFAGYTNWIDQFYRLQILDCFDYNSSFDFDLQPGGNGDIYDHFRNVAYSYRYWTPFWTARDTVRAGENWSIAGSGYRSFDSIHVHIGANIQLDTRADGNGYFSLSLLVPPIWRAGIYKLDVNGQSDPRPLHILQSPNIRALVDTLPITLRAGDSLVVKGTAFVPGERVDFYFDSIPLGQSAIADSNYGLQTMLRVPYLPDRSYLLIARGATSGNTTAENKITVTRTLRLEFEEMMPPIDTTASQCWAQNISYYWDAAWSKQTIVYFEPDTPFVNGHVTFAFPIDHADTFAMNVHGSIGLDLGDYAIALDGENVQTFNFWFNNLGWDPQPSGAVPIGTHYLTVGRHTMTFTCLGKSDSAHNYWMEPDVLVLTPTTYMPPLPGTIISAVDDPSPGLTGGSQSTALLLNPNPNAVSVLTISFVMPADAQRTVGSSVIFTLYDELGRKRNPTVTGSISEGEFHGSMSVADLPAGVYYLSAMIQRSDGYSAELSRARFVRQ